MIFRAAVGPRTASLIGTEFDATLGIAGHVVKTAAPAVVQNARADDRHFKGIG